MPTRAREEGLGRQLRGALTALGGGDGLARRGGCDDVHLLVERGDVLILRVPRERMRAVLCGCEAA